MGGRQEEQVEGEKDSKENLFKGVRAVENYSLCHQMVVLFKTELAGFL